MTLFQRLRFNKLPQTHTTLPATLAGPTEPPSRDSCKYYVTGIDRIRLRCAFLLGPFDSAEGALANIEHARALTAAKFPAEAPLLVYGTAGIERGMGLPLALFSQRARLRSGQPTNA
ncbi:MAG: hypothetical protein ACKO4U_04055 [Caldilinea sp.]